MVEAKKSREKGQSEEAEEEREAFFDPVDPTGEYDDTIRRRIELHPELSLMLAVLEAAVSSFQKHVSARDHKGRRIFREN